MTSLTRLPLDAAQPAAAFWPGVAAEAAQWCEAQGITLRDVIILLPYAGLLPAARAAFARRGAWQPRIETTHTLVATLGPPLTAASGQVSFDSSVDRLTAAQLLHSQATGAAWAKRDARGFDAAVAAMVDSAQQLLRAAQARPLRARDAFWQAWREALAPMAGPGGSERWLARIAVEWAADAEATAQDTLWSLEPAAWVGLQAGGRDALAESLLAEAAALGTPVLWLDADPPESAPFDAVAALPAPRRWRCDGLEDEAQAATLALLEALDAGHAPVALIAQDRLVVRRIRALLERAQVALRDETGWALSTTRAAARLMALLRAAEPAAGRDAVLDWLKSDGADAPAVQRLESAWRRGREPEASALALCDAAQQRLQALRSSGLRPLRHWLQALHTAAPALLRSLADDAAGRPLLAALHLDASAGDASWHAAADSAQLDFRAFTDWVDATLEAANFVPPSSADAAVVITPLASAALRPFAAVVMPGCDHLHLGAAAVAPGLLPDALLRQFDMPDAQARRERERLAFAHLLRVPQLTLLRRSSDQGEPLASSLLVDHAWQARRRLKRDAPAEVEAPLPRRAIVSSPASRPAPSAATALPTRLSASTLEALRACPYRFFGLTVLGLREAPELDAELEKRDHGTWLHGVMHRFHAERPDFDAAASDGVRLRAAADAEQAALGLDAAQLLPFRAAFESFCDGYLEWLHQRDRDGWRFGGGELSMQRDDARLGGMQLVGRIDRIDTQASDGTVQLVDYKTGSAQALRQKVAEPLEDTQLAFYAALLAGVDADAPMRAIYLALDDRKQPVEIEHHDVAASGELLVEGLAHDLAQMRAGAGLPALGEGAVCDYCEARGLCRRDHWAASP